MGTSLVAQLVKSLPAMWETLVRSLGWEGPLEKGKVTYSSMENSMDCIVHRVPEGKSSFSSASSLSSPRKQDSDWLPPFTLSYLCVCVRACVRACVCVCACVLVAQSRLTLCDSLGRSQPGASVPGTFQAKNGMILSLILIILLQGIFLTQELNPYLLCSCIAGRFFTR